MLHFILGLIGFVLGVFLLIDLIDKVLWWRANPLAFRTCSENLNLPARRLP